MRTRRARQRLEHSARPWPGVSRLACLAASLVLLGSVGLATPAAASETAGNPFVGQRQFLDCEASHERSAARNNPWYWARRLPRPQAALVERIAKVPAAKWFAGDSVRPRPTKMLERYLARVDDPKWGGPRCTTRLGRGRRDAYVGALPVLVVRATKHDRCRGYDGGGPWNRVRRGLYKPWINAFARQLQRTWAGPFRYKFWSRTVWPRHYFRPVARRAVVILEPDALGFMSRKSGCLSRRARRSRLALLNYAARRLARLPGVTTYIDAGSSSWATAGEAISMLRRAGVRHVRGFALNSTHFNATRFEIRYGRRLARALGGAHFVINTAENGRGAQPHRLGSNPTIGSPSCNPRNSGLGVPPTTRTASRWADAYLWISRPGLSSNGKCGRAACRRGPVDNVWWTQRALEEAQRAKDATPPWPSRPL
jgi:hypothetical protein